MFRRHSLRWHSAFGMAQTAAVALALPWLAEWVRYWWLTMPPMGGSRSVPFWSNWPPWAAEHADRVICISLVVCGFFGGLLRRHRRPRRPIKWLLLSSLIVTALALIAPASDLSAPFRGPAFLFLGLSLAIVPAANSLIRSLVWLVRAGRRVRLGFFIVAGVAIATLLLFVVGRPHWRIGWGLSPLVLDFSDGLAEIAPVIRERTRAEARILWEGSSSDTTPSAALLLPLLTERAYLCSAAQTDTDAAWASLADGVLAARPIHLWSDAELEAFFCRYNIGWIVAANETTFDRLNRLALAVKLDSPGPRRLYSLQRPLSYVLQGRASSVTADRAGISLADVVPEQGSVVLSFHYHEGLVARPGWVRVEREPDPYDPLPLIRLHLTAPASRVTLSWRRP
jgi:hypothetical protein